MALTTDRNTPEIAPNLSLVRVFPVAADVKIFMGALVSLDGTGYIKPGRTETGVRGLGIAMETIDNTGGAEGDQTIPIKSGIFRFDNSETDPVSRADIGKDCYIVDDEMVARTDGGATRSVAGKVFDVDEYGVWVRFDL
ncbi:hypothetical protein [Desulfovulcanus sp.]